MLKKLIHKKSLTTSFLRWVVMNDFVTWWNMDFNVSKTFNLKVRSYIHTANQNTS